ncbi:hypothetical protein K458DRAFT_22691 [Lentithecium fluviatile CBS 122367]|uniref:Uncharacterized protein n=1 Tax=Lentithecium fluviatile CBS 122367 TaxID=1168545 RepID=A0A6G1J503_9PLEO|nr:hypothetical protein K458DRAFT_22691 [Lentithecium fluviatile CBS 122367]
MVEGDANNQPVSRDRQADCVAAAFVNRGRTKASFVRKLLLSFAAPFDVDTTHKAPARVKLNSEKYRSCGRDRLRIGSHWRMPPIRAP